MKRLMPKVLLLIVLFSTSAFASLEKQSEVFRAMNDEIARQIKNLSLPEVEKPYFIEYTISDINEIKIMSSFGAISWFDTDKNRLLKVDLRVGDANLDQSNFISTSGRGSFGQTAGITFENDYDMLRHELWLTTDKAYKTAVETYNSKKAFLSTQRKQEENVLSFSATIPQKKDWKLETPEFDQERFKKLARKLSGIYKGYSDISSSGVNIAAMVVERHYVNSEGSQIYEPRILIGISTSAEAQTKEGGKLYDSATLYADSMETFPTEEELETWVKNFADTLITVKNADTLDGEYRGPVLFEGMAAAQLWKLTMASALSGTPPPTSERGGAPSQSNSLFTRIGRKVLPTFLSLEDDPTKRVLGKTPLIGSYYADEQGVLAQKVNLVSKGILKTLLSSRTPSKEVSLSNGHGRGHATGTPFGRIGNLFVQSRKTEKNLRTRAVKEAKSEGLPYVIVVKKIAVSAPSANPFQRPARSPRGTSNVFLAYKLYPDGKEEPIRGFTVASLDLRTMERDLLAVGKTSTVYNYLATNSARGTSSFDRGSGSSVSRTIPTSIITPDVLLSGIDARKQKGGSSPKPPVLKHPFFE